MKVKDLITYLAGHHPESEVSFIISGICDKEICIPAMCHLVKSGMPVIVLCTNENEVR